MKSRISVTLLVIAALSVPACSKNKGTNPMPVQESFDSGDLGTSGPSSMFVHRFATAGSFSYKCKYHFASGMTGTVTVAATGADSILIPMAGMSFGAPSPPFPLKTGGYVKWTNTSGLHTVTRP
jgi:plastocyanin